MKMLLVIVALLGAFAATAYTQDQMEEWRRREEQRQYQEQQERRMQEIERRQQEIENQRRQRQWQGPQVSPPGDTFRTNPDFKPYAR